MSEEMFEKEHISGETDTMTNAGNQAAHNQTPDQQNGYNAYQNGSQMNYQADNMGYNNGNTYQNMGNSGTDDAWKQQYLNPQTQQKKEQSNGFGIAALVLGIISLILFCTCINIPLAILAIVFAIIQLVKGAKSGAGKGMAIGGLITGIASLVCFVVFYVLISIGIIDAGSDYYYDIPYEDFQDDVDDFFNDLDYSYEDIVDESF